jgi:hypothetical protein
MASVENRIDFSDRVAAGAGGDADEALKIPIGEVMLENGLHDFAVTENES